MFAQLTHSSRKRGRLGSAAIVAGFSALILAGEAAADTYNFWLKSGPNSPYGGATKCAAGGFEFTKSGVTAGTPVSNLTMNISQGCINTETPAVNLALTGPLQVVVRNINLNGEAQGPNVDGVTGVLTSDEFTKNCVVSGGKNTPGTRIARWDVTFSSSAGAAGGPGVRTFTLQESAGECVALGTVPTFSIFETSTLASDAPYHVLNTTNQVPEPETLWLALVGLGGLAMVRRKRN